MADIDIKTVDGKSAGRTASLDEGVFGREVSDDALHRSILAHQTNQAIGAASTLTRSEVRGGGAKPYRQKGTGRARQGSIRAPHYEGGGIVHGPKPHKTRTRLNKKLRRVAVCSALSDKQAEGAIIVVEAPTLEEPKTRAIADMLAGLEVADKRVLLVMDAENSVVYKSARNLPKVQVRVAPSFDAYDVLWAEAVVLFDGAAEKLAEVWS